MADDRGDSAAAEEHFREALLIHQKASNANIHVIELLNDLGKIAWERKDYAKADEYLQQAFVVEQKVAPGSPLVADSFNLLGNVARDQGNRSEAQKNYSQALAIREKLIPGSPDHVESLMALASLLRDQQAVAAAQLFEKAVNAVENEVAHLGGTEESRSNFRARRTDYYKDYADLLMQQKQPERAFDILERSRARTLLELLAQAHVNIRGGVDAKLLEQESSVQADIRAKSERRIQLLGDKQKQQYASAVAQEIKKLLEDYQEIERQIQVNSPGYAALTQPQPLSAKEIQQQLLDPNTLLLEYSLGEERSYLFALTSNSLHSYELPKRAEIEVVARQLYKALATRTDTGSTLDRFDSRGKTQVDKLAADLSQMVVGPVAPELRGKRLLIVSDGALQYIPFAVLPVPMKPESGEAAYPKPAPPLVIEHEIVNLPSASVLAILRRETLGRKEAPRAVAVLADPVFDSKDERVTLKVGAKTSSQPEVSESAERMAMEPTEHLSRLAADIGLRLRGVAYLPRLPFTRREAEAILKVIPPGEGMKALDFSASREMAMSPELAQYRIVHFATHGLLDSQHPELSGLVLSLVDEQGKARNGLLDLQDIYNLDLPAELVVLSACETGLGKEINGEGLVGITRGFMYAGARRVLASLWNTDDAASAEFMARFYKAMQQERLSPAAALRQAQIETWKQKPWADPYYWAGFQLQGEWK